MKKVSTLFIMLFLSIFTAHVASCNVKIENYKVKMLRDAGQSIPGQLSGKALDENSNADLSAPPDGYPILRWERGTGEGTEKDPYIIQTAEDLSNLRNFCGKGYSNLHWKITNNIDLADYIQTTWGSAGWLPIGSGNSGTADRFCGHIDGGGHVISNLRINRSGLQAGLFNITEEAVIENLIIQVASAGITGANNTGALAAVIINGKVYRCGITGGKVLSTGNGCGGFCGQSQGSPRFEECYSEVEVQAANYAGAFNGGFNNYATILNCYSTGKVTSVAYTGGFAGILNGTGYTLTNCYSIGLVNSTSSSSGGFLGSRYAGTAQFNNVYYDSNTSGKSDVNKGIPKTTAEMKTQATYQNWDFAKVWIMKPGGYPILRWQNGIGTENDPYLIRTAEDLNNLRNFSGATYSNTYWKIVNDIDLEAYTQARWGFSGWLPIGYFASGASTQPFYGNIDGGFHTISNLRSYRPADPGGLFHAIQGAGIKNLVIEVAPSGIYGGNDVGVGALAAVIEDGNIYRCGITGGKITNTGRNCGGICGQSQGSPVFEECYSEVEVQALSRAGSFSGTFNNNATVLNCYSRGKVTSGAYTGGFIGMFDGANYTITNCYSTGLVNSTSSGSGGFLGSRYAGGVVQFNNVYYDQNTSGKSDVGNGIPKETEEMKSQSTYQNWDFTNVWLQLPGDYPILKWQRGTGSVENPYLITTAEDLNNLRNFCGKGYSSIHWRITNDIDLEDYIASHFGDIGWLPIGFGNTPLDFYGHIDGGGYTISNLRMNRVNLPSGLFYILRDAVVENLVIKVAPSGITGGGSPGVGALASVVIGGKIYRCGITGGKITSSSNGCGGFCGQSQGSPLFEECFSEVEVQAANYAGAFNGGFNNYATILNCYSTGKVTGAAYTGGLGGVLNGVNYTITNCYSTGLVNSTSSSSGGFLGSRYAGTAQFNNVYYDRNTSGKSDVNKGIPKTTAEMKTQSTYQNWDFEKVWTMTSGGYPVLRWWKGAGTEEDPYLIRTAEDFDNLRNFCGVTYDNTYWKIVNDIDLEEYLTAWNGGFGWIPIGYGNAGSQAEFYGQLDGGFHRIYNLQLEMYTANAQAGLFNALNNAVVKNLVVDVLQNYRQIGVQGKSYVGGLAAVITGSKIYRCGITGGPVSSTNINNNYACGGICGVSQGNSEFEECYSEVDVRALNYVGCFVGSFRDNATIRNCYSTGQVNGGDYYTGGFLGLLTGNVFNITNCYSMGRVYANLGGGFAGQTYQSPTVHFTSVYYDRNTSWQSDVGRGTPKTTTEMKTQSTYVNWDFNSVWVMDDGYQTSYTVAAQAPGDGGADINALEFEQQNEWPDRESGIEVYPNPVCSGNSVSVKLDLADGISDEVELHILNSLGMSIERIPAAGKNIIPVTLPEEKGIYYIKVISHNRSAQVKKVVVM